MPLPSGKLTSQIIITILLIVIFFHLLVLTGIIPYTIVWGGRLEDASQMVVFELISMTVNLLIIAVVAMRAGFIKSRLSDKTYRIIFWVLTILFGLNTLGNIFSESTWEAIIFTPVTLILTVLFFRLARGGNGI